jgi:hypothetical protein
MRLHRDKRGDIFAYFAVIMVFLMVPLSSLAIDIVRGMYVRGHLHTATDAACQAAADALDAPLFVQTGQKQIKSSLARSQANQVFYATLVDADNIRFTPSVQVQIVSPTKAHCTARASVARLIPGTLDMNVVTFTESEMRVNTLN